MIQSIGNRLGVHIILTSFFITPFALNQQSAFILYMCAAIFAITPFVWRPKQYQIVRRCPRPSHCRPRHKTECSNLPLRNAYMFVVTLAPMAVQRALKLVISLTERVLGRTLREPPWKFVHEKSFSLIFTRKRTRANQEEEYNNMSRGDVTLQRIRKRVHARCQWPSEDAKNDFTVSHSNGLLHANLIDNKKNYEICKVIGRARSDDAQTISTRQTLCFLCNSFEIRFSALSLISSSTLQAKGLLSFSQRPKIMCKSTSFNEFIASEII